MDDNAIFNLFRLYLRTYYFIFCIMKTKVKTPKYYNGKNGYTAKEVVDNFDLTYHLGTAVTYILRSYRKHDSPNEDLQKAIDHLTFELEKLEENDQWFIEQYNRNRSPEDWVM